LLVAAFGSSASSWARTWLPSPGGALAVVGGGHVVPDGGDSFFLEMQDVYQALGEAEPGWQPPRPDERADQREELSSSGLLTEVAVRRYLREQTYTAEDYISLLETFSAHRVMDAGNREALYRAIRERVNHRSEAVIRYHTVLILTVARSAG
jgi:hypothetical protein